MTFAKQTHRRHVFLGKQRQVTQMPHFTFEILQMCLRKIPTYLKSACQSEEGIRNKRAKRKEERRGGLLALSLVVYHTVSRLGSQRRTILVYYSKELLKT